MIESLKSLSKKLNQLKFLKSTIFKKLEEEKVDLEVQAFSVKM